MKKKKEVLQTGWEEIFCSPTGLSPIRMSIRFPNPVNEKTWRIARKHYALRVISDEVYKQEA